MATENPTDRTERDVACPALEDAKVQRAVMAYMLQEHPVLEILVDDFKPLTVLELSRMLNDDPGDFSTYDAVERAVRDLVGVGLLECRDGRVEPTDTARYEPSRAARHLSRLDASCGF